MAKNIRLNAKSEKLVQRLLEILPGFFSWNLILFPYWGIFLIPTATAYFVLIFDIYWLYQSFSVAILITISHFRIEAAKKLDWRNEIKSFPDWKNVKHLIIIPTYKEPLHILERTLNSIKNQDLPKDQLYIVISMEKKEDKEIRKQKTETLKEIFGKTLPHFYIITHELKPGEIAGKSSNERFAALWFYNEIIIKQKIDTKYLIVTSCDADHVFYPKYFSALTFQFLDDPNRYERFWQPAVLFYNNIWNLPAITRIQNILGSIWGLARLSRKDSLINNQNYSLSFKLLKTAEFWDANIIPEDYHIFFKAFYKTNGKVEVEPIYLPLFADSPESDSFLKTLTNQYRQIQRWAWGVSDDPYVIRGYFLSKKTSIINKTSRLLTILKEHFLWPVNWFIVTLGLTIPSLLNPVFSRTVIGYTLPRISSFILTISLVFLAIMLLVESKHRPRPQNLPKWREIIQPLEFILLPIAGFFFNALPGLDAHTRLMLGKYLEYKVTEKM